MNRAEFTHSLKAASASLQELKLLHTALTTYSLKASAQFKDLARDPSADYLALYESGLATRDYNFLLADYSYIQCSQTVLRAACDVRYAFYPNPRAVADYDAFCLEWGLLAGDPQSYEFFQQYLAELPARMSRPVVRYEHAAAQRVELRHPTAHIHFSYLGEDRWAVARLLTPLAFVLLIAKTFYTAAWAAADGGAVPNRFDVRCSSERARCGLLPETSFSALEREHLHFA